MAGSPEAPEFTDPGEGQGGGTCNRLAQPPKRRGVLPCRDLTPGWLTAVSPPAEAARPLGILLARMLAGGAADSVDIRGGGPPRKESVVTEVTITPAAAAADIAAA